MRKMRTTETMTITNYDEKNFDKALQEANEKFNQLIRFFLSINLLIPTMNYSDINEIVIKLEQLKSHSESTILNRFKEQ